MKIILSILLLVTGSSFGAGPASKPDAGKKLYEEKCSICHEIRDPKLYTQKKLKSQFAKYAAGIGINAKQKVLIMNYILPKAKDTKTAK